MAVAKMIKVFIAGPFDNREETMRLLQEVGVLHVEPASEMAGEFEKQSSDLLSRVKKLKQLIAALKPYKKRETAAEITVEDENLIPFAEEKFAAINEMESRVKTLERLKDDLALWGNFEPEQIEALENSGVYVRRFRMEEKKWEEFDPPEDLYLEVVFRKKEVCFYTVSVGDVVEIPQAQMLPWPDISLDDAESELGDISKRIEKCSDELAAVAARVDTVKKQLVTTMNESDYMNNMATLYEEHILFGLQGWIPEKQEEAFLEKVAAAELPLQIVTRPPDDDEEPPILLRNNWLVSSIEPLLTLYGLPKYREIDPSFYFAPFMVLFFGICLGDAGYGLLFLAIAYFAGRKWGKDKPGLMQVVKLCEFFSIASIIFGVITGTIFGISFAERSWILLDIDVNLGNPKMLLYIALGIGFVHLSLSYILGIKESEKLHEKMEKLGTMFVLWGGVTIFIWLSMFKNSSSVLNKPFLYAGVGLAIAGLLLTLLFANDSKNWFARLGLGLWNIYGLTGLIGDFLSYARLFGLGLATAAIGSVMNLLAGMVYSGAGPIIGGFFAVLILIIGHGFNFALSLLGSTVHSARLHFVETFPSFYEGGGVEYKPFKIERGSL
ncbi:MAG: hypothetical protein JW902_17170 [Syntrophaceae bacterium]|nr:hypothetical protein [Syntrophaceae bacterium]